MARVCNLNPNTGVKGRCYAVTADGGVERLTRSRLLAGRMPEGTVAVVAGVHGRVSRSDIASGRVGLRLDPLVAQSLTGRRLKAARRLSDRREPVEAVHRSGRWTAQVDVFEVAGRRVTFGVPAEFDPGAGVVNLPKNPYRIAGVDPGTVQGRDLALRYTAALAAVSAAQGCPHCGVRASCALCSVRGDASLRREAHSLLGGAAPSIVDALLLASASGDEEARLTFEAVAALGEQMVSLHRRRLVAQHRSSVWNVNDGTASTGGVGSGAASGEARSAVAAARKEWEERYRRVRDSDDYDGRAADLAALEWEADHGWRKDESLLEIVGQAAQSGGGEFDIDDLWLVHETGHGVVRDPSGDVVLYPAEDHVEGLSRPTLHFCLNGVVGAHMWRDSTSSGALVVVQLRDVLEANPECLENLFTADTFLTPPPGAPLRLPAKSVKVIDFEVDGRVLSPQERASELEAFLTEVGTRSVTIGTHHSEPAFDARVRLMAGELGVPNSTLHNSCFIEHTENLLNRSDRGRGEEPVLTLTPERLAELSVNARRRLFAHDRWSSVTPMPVSSVDDGSVMVG